MKQSVLKKFIIAAMAVYLLLFTACSLFSQQPDVSGRYETVFPISRYLSEENVAFLEENGLGFVKDLEGRYEMVIGEDSTFQIKFDAEKLGEEIFAGVEANKDEIFRIVMERNKVEEKDYEVFAERNGYASVDELKDALIERMENEIANNAGLTNLSGKNTSGNYTVKKDRITFQNASEKYDHATIDANGSLLIDSFFAKGEQTIFTKLS